MYKSKVKEIKEEYIKILKIILKGLDK